MAIELSLKFWMGLLLGALVVAFIFIPLSRNLWGLLPANIDEASYASFLELDKVIVEIAGGTKNEKEIPFYIKQDAYILVGFNRDCGYNNGDRNCPVAVCHSSDSDYYIPKPKECSVGKSCLCLFNDFNLGDFDDEDNKPVVPCVSYDSIDYLVGKNGDLFNDGNLRVIGNKEYESLVIYGDCNEEWGVHKMRLEKILIGDKILVMFSAV